MAGSHLARGGAEVQRDQREAFALDAADHFADEAAGHAVGLDEDEGAFSHAEILTAAPIPADWALDSADWALDSADWALDSADCALDSADWALILTYWALFY
ncbi:hypothetical protein nbrc107697_16130 [Gordonia crocea]|uniref:Uncharacterized protein n=1 Tax=Gordonia crocea TaxID=589162 RepID=A0A7I9UWJ1_9ACTN|nr:hypothetical protein nbrc107697_16130 [Gordonia crocea]